jgi:ATP-dependent Zn protease
MLAQEEARRLGHNFVGTEQILLGLIGEGTGVAAKVLRSMGVKLKDARLEVEKIIGRGSGYVGAEIPFTPRAKRVLELSLEEAQQLEHSYVGTEHLLLGLIREGEGVAVRVLVENLGVDISKVRTQVIQMLGEIAEVEENISQDDSNTPQDDSNTPQDNNTNTLLFDDIEKLKAFIKDNIKEELKTISENNKINNYSQHIAKKFNENQPQFSFDDIGGAAQAKEELKTIIEFIRNPEYFQSLGARMPKGIILEGLPGTGKTLLAKAVASESNAHFFYMSASEFVELYVGVGASRVRDLFNEAKKNQPAIIYIDELDAVGQHRNSSSGANEERNNTLNQLLTELDGFESCQRIFVMASTNRGDMLDAALVRPGRFDKRIVVDLPSFAERCQILEIHLQNKKIAEDVNIEDIARYTIDFSGAELANIVNQAAILAAKNKCDSINQHLLEETTKAQGAIVPSAINVQQLKQDISKEIVGQNAALTAIAWSVCSHYANIFSRSESGVSYGNKPNLFLYGPPGSGKTAIIKATAKTLEVPFVEMTASGLVKEQAYVQKILNRLL